MDDEDDRDRAREPLVRVAVASPFSREVFVLEGDLPRAREILGDRATG